MKKKVLELFYEYSYYDLKKEKEKCCLILTDLLSMASGSLDLWEKGLILHMASEYTGNFQDLYFSKLQVIDDYTSNIIKYWQDPVHQDTYKLGAIYGGLRGINRYLKRDDVAQSIMTIKAYVFKNFINQGMLCSDNLKVQTQGQMLLACVPFGLYEPEDLVLVEAVSAINKRRLSTTDGLDEVEELLLAWYFVEQGTYAISRQVLNKLNKDSYLYKLVFAKLAQKGGVEEKVIIHNPQGNNNIYEPGNDERFPKLITEADQIIIKAIAYPLDSNEPVLMEYNGEILDGEIVDKAYWQFELKNLKADESHRYKLFFDKDKNIQTDYYSMPVFEKNYVSEFTLYRNNEHSIELKNEIIRVTYKIDSKGIFTLQGSNDKTRVRKNDLYNKAWCTISDYNKLTVEKGDYLLKVDPKSGSFDYYDKDKIIVSTPVVDWLELSCDDKEIQQINCSIHSKDEKYYGFGERYNALDQRGKCPDNFVYNQYKEQGLRTYIPMPFYVSDGGYGLLVETSNYSNFDMANLEADKVTLQVDSGNIDIKIIPGTMDTILRKHAQLTGLPQMIPKWALGPWMSSNNWDSESEVRNQVDMTNKLDIPATVLVIEAWSDEATFYIFNDAKYNERPGQEYFEYKDFTFPKWGRWPDPKGMVDHLHDNNLKCILWQIPIIKQITSLNHLQKDLDEKTFIDNGYGVLRNDKTPYRLPEGWFKDSLLMDFSNSEATKWWFDKRRYLLEDLNVDGFKTDGGEFVFGKDLLFSDGRTGAEMRNEYANDYISAYYDFAKGNDGITFSRAGYKGANQFPAHWAGDERSTFDAFKRSILAGLSSGISGLPFWGWDLAGFSGDVPSAELFIRSTQMATFCPIMQYHAESKGEFNQDRTPWNIQERSGDDRAVSVYRKFANMRMNLLPYIYEESLEASRSGLPLMKALVVAYQEDKTVHDIWDQYMFGDKLLVAPVIDQGAVERSVYFPQGKWHNLFDGKSILGPTNKKFEAKLEDMPVFVKSNTVLPLNLNEDFELGGRIGNDLEAYKKLCFCIYGESIHRYDFEDDLGHFASITVESTVGSTVESTVDGKSRSACKMQVTMKTNLETCYLLIDEVVKEVTVNGKVLITQKIMLYNNEMSMLEVLGNCI